MSGDDKMAPWVKVFTAQSEDLGLTSQNHGIKEEN